MRSPSLSKGGLDARLTNCGRARMPAHAHELRALRRFPTTPGANPSICTLPWSRSRYMHGNLHRIRLYARCRRAYRGILTISRWQNASSVHLGQSGPPRCVHLRGFLPFQGRGSQRAFRAIRATAQRALRRAVQSRYQHLMQQTARRPIRAMMRRRRGGAKPAIFAYANDIGGCPGVSEEAPIRNLR